MISKIIHWRGEDGLIPASLNAPHIVCLCGSSQFKDSFMDVAAVQTLMGKIVVMPDIWMHRSEPGWITAETKANLDELHLRKIDLADEVYVVNVDGYIGESTKNEIAYAEKYGKPITYMEKP